MIVEKSKCSEIYDKLKNWDLINPTNKCDIRAIEPVNYFEFYHLFNELFHLSHSENFFWEYCTFKVYKGTFHQRFIDYQAENYDGEFSDYVEDEIKLVDSNISFDEYEDNFYQFKTIDCALIIFNDSLARPIEEQINLAQKKKNEFLEGQKYTETINLPSSLNFKGSSTELVELIKAMVDNGNFEENQVTVFKELSSFLNVTFGKDVNLFIQDIKHRTNKTKYLDKLKQSLSNSLNKI